MPYLTERPSFARFYAGDMPLRNSVFSGNLNLCARIISNFRDVRMAQYRHPMPFTKTMSLLARRISIVIQSGAFSKMGRIYARWVVAGMHNNILISKGADPKLIRKSVSSNGFFGQDKNSVSSFVAGPSPFPTMATFFDARFKCHFKSDLRKFTECPRFTMHGVMSPAQTSRNANSLA